MSDTKTSYPTTLPVLALKGVVVLPHMPIALGVGRPKSVRALEEAMSADRLIALVSQKDEQIEDPSGDDLYSWGVVARVLNVGK